VTLERGSSGYEVTELQQKLHAAGFNPGSADGHFGPATEHAVVSFQQAAGLTADGYAGPNTMHALEAHLAHGTGGGGKAAALDVVAQALDPSCEWVGFLVHNSGAGDSADNAFFSWITVQPERSGTAVWTHRDGLAGIRAGQQNHSWVRLPNSIADGNYDVHVGILDANNNWVTQQPYVVEVAVRADKFAPRQHQQWHR
jgi:Putative peptidoglycan binding domain